MSHTREDFMRLLEVQEKERGLLELEKEQRRLPEVLEELKSRIEEAEGEVAAAKAEVKGLQVRKKELEIESETKLEEVRKYEGQQYQVKSNVEYQALQKEIIDRKVANSRIEDRIIEVMERVEEKERLVKIRTEAVGAERTSLNGEETRIAEDMAKLGERIAALKAERDAILPGISPPVLRKYQRIFANKRDTAIVPLDGYTCGGCHMQLPPQIANNVRKMDELVICENCSRILYWPGGLGGAKADEAGE